MMKEICEPIIVARDKIHGQYGMNSNKELNQNIFR